MEMGKARWSVVCSHCLSMGRYSACPPGMPYKVCWPRLAGTGPAGQGLTVFMRDKNQRILVSQRIFAANFAVLMAGLKSAQISQEDTAAASTTLGMVSVGRSPGGASQVFKQHCCITCSSNCWRHVMTPFQGGGGGQYLQMDLPLEVCHGGQYLQMHLPLEACHGGSVPANGFAIGSLD
eukprot:1159779-Pelagomonas_calceolata.AAC.9